MRQTELLQEIQTMRFEEVYEIWNQGRLTQAFCRRAPMDMELHTILPGTT